MTAISTRTLRNLGWSFGTDGTNLGPALDEFLHAQPQPPRLLALGEPMHGVEMFPQLRNLVLQHLVVQHGYRAIALETDCLAALAVNDYVTTGVGDVEQVLTTGFSHGFGNIAANKELVTWLREYNQGREAANQVRFYGFDTPTEMSGAASPRAALANVHQYLTVHLEPARIPHSWATFEELLGDDETWTNSAAALDPTQSVGQSAQARELRVVTDDLLGVLETEVPGLRQATSAGDYERACLFARTAHGLLRYHAAMADQTHDSTARLARMLAVRDASMAANLVALAEIEAHRGPSLVFAHNNHVHRNQSAWQLEGMDLRWWPAGSLAALQLGTGYAMIATDLGNAPQHGITDADSDTLQGGLATATESAALFPTDELVHALGGDSALTSRSDTPPEAGYFPLDPTKFSGVDAIAFVRHAA